MLVPFVVVRLDFAGHSHPDGEHQCRDHGDIGAGHDCAFSSLASASRKAA